jgi:hypothetical protein
MPSPFMKRLRTSAGSRGGCAAANRSMAPRVSNHEAGQAAHSPNALFIIANARQ